jgi:hypothetical protein
VVTKFVEELDKGREPGVGEGVRVPCAGGMAKEDRQVVGKALEKNGVCGLGSFFKPVFDVFLAGC